MILSLIGFAGVIMITDPTFMSFSSLGSEHIEGIVLLIISALFYSINMSILRKTRKSYHWTQTESVAGLWATFVFTPVYIAVCYYVLDVPLSELIQIRLSMTEWILVITISVFAFIAIAGVTRALQLEKLIIVSIILYSKWCLLHYFNLYFCMIPLTMIRMDYGLVLFV